MFIVVNGELPAQAIHLLLQSLDPVDALLSFIVIPVTDSFVLLLSTQRQIRIVHWRAPSSSRHHRSNRRVLLHVNAFLYRRCGRLSLVVVACL